MTLYDMEWKVQHGAYRFEIWFDSGNECGLDQRDVFVRERTPIERVPLKSIPGRRLLAAYRGADRAAREAAFAEAVAQLEARFAPALQTPAQASASVQPHAQLDKEQRRQRNRQRRHLQKQRHAARVEQGQATQRLEEALRKELAALPQDQFDLEQLAYHVQRFDDGHFLRSFYFEEVNDAHIRNFVRKYAEDSSYRTAVDAGTTPWARRNALFTRNLWIERPTDAAAERLWRWFCEHAEAILALPEYVSLQARDSAFDPDTSREYDPEIRAAVAAWNRVPGVQTRWSCQGVSGVVVFQGHEIYAATPHVARAYVEFAAFSELAANAVRDLAPDYPTLEVQESVHRTGAGNATDWQVERSVSTLRSLTATANLAFRQDCVRLAEAVYRHLCP
jgi:hypothetical protein